MRAVWVGSPQIFATISVASLTSYFWPARARAAGGVTTWMRTVRAESVAAVWIVAGSMRWMKAAVLARWKAQGLATPSARRTA